jgi:hypothetical protein
LAVPVTVRGEASAGHFSVQVEPVLHMVWQVAVQTVWQVELSSQLTVAASPTV